MGPPSPSQLLKRRCGKKNTAKEDKNGRNKREEKIKRQIKNRSHLIHIFWL